jgi:hypothetical protein
MAQPRRFPPPWTVEELDACFVVIDSAEQKLAYVYFEEESGRRSAAKSGLLSCFGCAIRMVTPVKAAPPIVAGSNADNFPKTLDAMALIGETHGIKPAALRLSRVREIGALT